MPRLVHVAAMCAVLIAGVTSRTRAQACLDNPPNSIYVVGTLQGNPDPRGIVTLHVTNCSGDNVAGATVELDFSGCPNITLCNTNVAGQTLECFVPALQATTDENGLVTFTVLGAANPNAGCINTACASSVVQVKVNSIPVTNIAARCLDLDGGSGLPGRKGLNSADIGVLARMIGCYGLFGSAAYFGWADISGNGTLAGNDIGIYSTYVGAYQSQNGGGCPGTLCP